MAGDQAIVVVKDICKTFDVPGSDPVHALRYVTNHVNKGEVLVVIGPSGSGKSTFLRALNGLESVDSGSIVIDECAIIEEGDPDTVFDDPRHERTRAFLSQII